jgi:hypothetical protein
VPVRKNSAITSVVPAIENALRGFRVPSSTFYTTGFSRGVSFAGTSLKTCALHEIPLQAEPQGHALSTTTPPTIPLMFKHQRTLDSGHQLRPESLPASIGDKDSSLTQNTMPKELAEQHRVSFGPAMLTASLNQRRISSKYHGSGLQAVYFITIREEHGKVEKRIRARLCMYEKDKILLTDPSDLMTQKKERRYERLVKTRGCSRNYPDWLKTTQVEQRLERCKQVARALSQVRVFGFDEC